MDDFFWRIKKNISKTRQKTFPRFKNISLIISEKDSVTFLFEVLVSFSSEFGRTILLISGKTRVVIGQSSISEFWKKSVEFHNGFRKFFNECRENSSLEFGKLSLLNLKALPFGNHRNFSTEFRRILSYRFLENSFFVIWESLFQEIWENLAEFRHGFWESSCNEMIKTPPQNLVVFLNGIPENSLTDFRQTYFHSLGEFFFEKFERIR